MHLGVEALEVTSLVVVAIGYLILIAELRKHKNLLYIFIAYTFLLIGAVATVLEGFYFPNALNFVEHLVGRTFAGIVFGLTAFLAYRNIVKLESEVKKKLR